MPGRFKQFVDLPGLRGGKERIHQLAEERFLNVRCQVPEDQFTLLFPHALDQTRQGRDPEAGEPRHAGTIKDDLRSRLRLQAFPDLPG